MAGDLVLIVDDNEMNGKLVEIVLRTAGYDVRIAHDAEEAVTMLENMRPQLILMDIQLPGMDGLTLTRRLKADPATSQIPVVALTAYAMKGDDRKAYDAGCAGYLTKPIDTRRLPLQVAEMIASAQISRL